MTFPGDQESPRVTVTAAELIAALRPFIVRLETVPDHALPDAEQGLHRAAVENLIALPPPRLHRMPAWGDRADTELLIMESSDIYGAARYSYLPRLPDWATDGVPAEHGVLVAMPSWDTLVLHVVRRSGAAAALERMAELGRTWREAAQPAQRLTSDVFYLAPDGRNRLAARIAGHILERYPSGPIGELGFDVFAR